MRASQSPLRRGGLVATGHPQGQAERLGTRATGRSPTSRQPGGPCSARFQKCEQTRHHRAVPEDGERHSVKLHVRHDGLPGSNQVSWRRDKMKPAAEGTPWGQALKEGDPRRPVPSSRRAHRQQGSQGSERGARAPRTEQENTRTHAPPKPEPGTRSQAPCPHGTRLGRLRA